MSCNPNDIERILQEYGQKIRGFFRKKGFCEVDTEDLAQETMLAVIEGFPRFKGGSSVSTWIYSICNNQYRKKMYYVHRDKLIEKECSMRTSHEASYPFDEFFLRYILESLPEIDRRIYVLYYTENFSVKEVATLTRLPEGTIKFKLFQIRKHVGKNLFY